MSYVFDRNHIILLLASLVLIFSFSCQQAKEIPKQIPKELPNPVSDFTENDRYKLGLRWYQQGQYDIARKMWKPMAQNGDCDAQYALGLLYFNGLSVRKSYKNALTWWSRAAEQAQPQSLNTLGIVYAHLRVPYTSLDCKKGCGETKNLVKAYKWFGLAKEYGPPREIKAAQKSLDRISKEMSDAEIKEAQIMIDEWEPKPAKCKSRGLFIVN
ncbi:MAG: tetratricopeptide repeat protein [Candidatus Dadabacteria bacterium]|nr:tetratricopeptide repeat protein [Candidatus Dadabacteria bacterium]